MERHRSRTPASEHSFGGFFSPLGGSVSFGWLSNDFHPDGYIGDPTGATAEKGRIFLDAFTNEFTDFLVQLSQADLNELYE